MLWLKKLEDYTLKKAVQKIGGLDRLSIQLDITNACNLKCAHCYHPHHKNAGAMDLNGWFEVLNQYDEMLKTLKLKPSVVICGGEPLISPYLYSVLKRINELWGRTPVSILTNGTKLTPQVLEMLKQHKVELQISIDGPNRETHDAVRGEGNFEKAMVGAKLAKAHGIKANVLGVLSQKSSKWIPEFFEMAKENNLDSMNFTRFIPQGQGSKLVESGADDSLYGTDLRDALVKIVQISKAYGVSTSTDSPLYHLIDPSLGKNGGFGFQGLVVDYKGNLKVSSRADFVLGNVLEKGLQSLFLKHPLMKSLRNREINGCGSCMYYSRCGGDRNISYATTGSFLEKDKGCWIKPEEQITKGKIA